MSYMVHSVGPQGQNIVKMKQISTALLYFKLPLVILADWNMTPEESFSFDFLGLLNAEIKAVKDIDYTCNSGRILDYMVVSRTFSPAISSFRKSTTSSWKPHCRLEVSITRSPRSLHILAQMKSESVPLGELLPVDERPHWQDIRSTKNFKETLAKGSDIENSSKPIFVIFIDESMAVGDQQLVQVLFARLLCESCRKDRSGWVSGVVGTFANC